MFQTIFKVVITKTTCHFKANILTVKMLKCWVVENSLLQFSFMVDRGCLQCLKLSFLPCILISKQKTILENA